MAGPGAREAYVRHLWAADWLSAAAQIPLVSAGAVNAVAHEHGRHGALDGLAGGSPGLQSVGAGLAGGGLGTVGIASADTGGALRPSPLAVALGPGAGVVAGARRPGAGVRPRGGSDGLVAGLMTEPGVRDRERVLSFSSDSADGNASLAGRTAHSTDDERERDRLFPMDGQGVSLETSPLMGAARTRVFAGLPDLDLGSSAVSRGALGGTGGVLGGGGRRPMSPQGGMSGGEEEGQVDMLSLAGFSREGVGTLGVGQERRVEVDSSDSADSGGSASSSTSSSDDGTGGSEEDDEGESGVPGTSSKIGVVTTAQRSTGKRARQLRANGRKSPSHQVAHVGPTAWGTEGGSGSLPSHAMSREATMGD